MKKRCLLLILALIFLLASCGENADNQTREQSPAENQESDNTNGDSDNPESAAERIPANVPGRDFDGYEFTILANSTAYNPYWYSKDIWVEEETGDLINDAVYTRNRAVEERFNIEIMGIFSGNQFNDARRSILANDNNYDMHTVPLQGATAQLAQQGLLLDLKNVPFIDLEKPWWDQKANEQLSISHRVMFTISDLLIIDKDALFIFLFNKDVIQELGLEDPYQLVKNGAWTIDKMWEMAQLNSRDINGDGIMDDTDSYGLLTAGHTIHGNVVSSGHFVITKDKDDLPVLNITHPIIQATIEKWLDMKNDRSNTWIAQDWDSRHADIWLYQLDVLSEGRGMFLYAGMDRVTTLRTFDFNFGILPNPKFDESQDEYFNHVHAWCTTAISIPVTSDPERTGIILEALTAESYYTLRPAYYEVSLMTKFLRDDESGEMLDLIFSTRCYDLGHVYNWGGVFDMFSSLPLQSNQQFVSAYERIMPRIEADMQAAIEMFLEQ